MAKAATADALAKVKAAQEVKQAQTAKPLGWCSERRISNEASNSLEIKRNNIICM